MTPAASAPQRSRYILAALLILFFGSLLVPFALFYGGFRPQGTTNHGELIQPARPLPRVTLLGADDQMLDPELLRSKWTVAYVGAGGCDARCREALTMSRQVWLALGRESQRVQRVFFVTGGCCDLEYLRTEQPGLITARLDEAVDRKFLDLFPAHQQGRTYIIDPLGNLMMSYVPGTPPKGMLEDLKRLLKLSRIG